MRIRLTPTRVVVGLVLLAALILCAIGPYIFSDFFLRSILTKTMWLGIAASSLIFLAGFAGMVSLGQAAIYSIAGFVMGNLVAADGGVDTALSPWVGVILGLLASTVIGLVFGAVAARSAGIYFLMITLAFSVLNFYFWGASTDLSGFGGINNITTPSLIGNAGANPNRLFYVAFVVSILVYAFLRYLIRTPFGITLQGIRDEPTRMRALGYNVPLHRVLAFTIAAFIAGIAGVLFIWQNANRIDPNSVNLGNTIDVLVVAVVGGLFRLEGAWLGAFVFTVLETYSKNWDLINERFNTVIGAVFLVIVLLSPGGLLGIWESARGAARRLGRGTTPATEPGTAGGGEPGAT